MIGVVEELTSSPTSQPLTTFAYEHSVIGLDNRPASPNSSNKSNISTDDTGSRALNYTNIESSGKVSQFEKLIQDVRDKYGISECHRLTGEQHHQKNNMGANVSRHSAKDLSGRRTLSSSE